MVADVRPEQQRLAAALDGDGLAFRALVEPHLPMLYRIAYRISGNPALAEDAVQETLAAAYRGLGRYRPQSSLRAFLAAVAMSKAHTLARAERRRQRREQQAALAVSPVTPEQELGAAMLARRMREAVWAMPARRRAAALMRLDAGLSHREIAVALGASEGAARVLVHEAVRELRERLSDVLDSEAQPPPSPTEKENP